MVVSHCLMNNLAKVEAFENQNRKVPELLLEKGVGIIALPCPEFRFFGGRRWGMVKEQMNTPVYREHCRNLLRPILDEILEYQHNGHTLAGVLGIKGSPSCGVTETCSSKEYGGEIDSINNLQEVIAGVTLIPEPGVFMEEFQGLLLEKGCVLPFLQVDEKSIAQTLKEIEAQLLVTP